MIQVHAKLIEADIKANGYSVSVEACKKMVEKFDKLIPVRLGTSPLILGYVKKIFYDEKTKAVVGQVELNVDLVADGVVLQKLQTPDGIRVLECDIRGVKFIPGGRK